MDFAIQHENDTAVIKVNAQKLNAANAPDLKSELVLLNKNNVNNIVISMSKCKYCDSSGLSAVLVANRMCKDTIGKFILCGLQPNVEKLIQIAQLDRVLSITSNEKEALELI